MEDLIDSASTTAEQKFMLMMFERLEALEDKVTNLTVENQNLKKNIQYLANCGKKKWNKFLSLRH